MLNDFFFFIRRVNQNASTRELLWADCAKTTCYKGSFLFSGYIIQAAVRVKMALDKSRDIGVNPKVRFVKT